VNKGHLSSWDFDSDPDKRSTDLSFAKPEPRDSLFAVSPEEGNNTPIGFGKYRAKTPVQILECDPEYLRWAIQVTGRINCSEPVRLAALEMAERPEPSD